MVVPSLHCTSAPQEVSSSPFLHWRHTVRARSTHGSRGSISIQAQTPKSLPELCCRHTLAPSCPLLSWLTHWFPWMVSSPFCCSWLDPLDGLQTWFITSPWLQLSMGPCYPHPALPIQLRCCRTVPWLVRALPVLGSPSAHSLPLLMVQPHSCCSLTLTTTATWRGPSPQRSLASEKPPVKSPGMFTLLAPSN